MSKLTEGLKEQLATAKKLQARIPFEPVYDTLIVYRMKLEKTAGGIVLPDASGPATRGYACTAVVLAVGPGRYGEYTGHLIPVPVQAGDVILMSSLSGLELGEVARADMGGEASFEEIRLIKGTDVLTKIKEDHLT